MQSIIVKLFNERKHKRKKKCHKIKGYFNRVLLEQKTLFHLGNFMVFWDLQIRIIT